MSVSKEDAKDAIRGATRKVRGTIGASTSSAKGYLDEGFNMTRAITVEKHHEFSVMWMSFIIIVITSVAFFLIGWAINDGSWSYQDFFYNMGCNILAMFIAVLCLDTLVNRNRDSRLQRNEARKILRHNRLISPDIDMYLVRKNMVITPNGKPIHKFQIESEFSVRDMRDMYTPSDLVSDVGISKIKRYQHYQSVLRVHFEDLVESVDFTFYPEIVDAAMRYLNATSYGEAALDAVVSYEDGRTGMKSTRLAIVSMIRDEPEDGSFVEADPMMKNVYLVHQLIQDQQRAVSQYMRMIRTLQEKDSSGYMKRDIEDDD